MSNKTANPKLINLDMFITWFNTRIVVKLKY